MGFVEVLALVAIVAVIAFPWRRDARSDLGHSHF